MRHSTHFQAIPTEPRRFSGSGTPEQVISRLERRCARERAARLQAESYLEDKSLELFEANKTLRELNQHLEALIEQRTKDLRRALNSAREANALFEYHALHDPLTGLPNRRFLRQKLDELVEQAAAEESSLAILHVDLDRFKQINDTLGHAAGDFVLKHVADILREQTRDKAFVARIGGDEFVVAATFGARIDAINEMASSLIRRMSEPVPFDGNLLRFAASVGVAHEHGSKVSVGQLLVDADLALYRAKDAGRSRVSFFTRELEADMRARKRIADELFEALERDELVPYYHPRINARDRRIDCVEALVRWRHPKRGLLNPDKFLSIADDIGLTAQIDDVVLSKAVKDFVHWRDHGADIDRLSVNVSKERLLASDLLERMDRQKVPCDHLSFELLESIFLDDADEAALSRIEALKERGVAIEIDDFGSGHASIVSVMRIRPKAIKIDRRLVRGIVADQRQADLVQAIVDIGKSLCVEVIAEGIETPVHVERCAELGCDSLQGYAFAKPMDADAMFAFTKTFRG